MKLLAVVRLRGTVNVKDTIERTFKLMKMDKKNSCVVLSDSKRDMGMINKVKDYVTYGEIDNATLVELLKSRSDEKSPEKAAKEAFEKGVLKVVFRLHPPRGGMKSIKRTFKSKGDLGYRGEEINKLLRRMI
jgi:large subunit ribosomal protein L30